MQTALRQTMKSKAMVLPRFLWSELRSFRHKLPYPALRKFQRKVAIRCETENLVLKTAENPFELRQALALRHEVFYRELQNKSLQSRIDIDEFDLACDHIVIIDKKLSRIVGTYRVNSTVFSSDFYSQTEFSLQEFFQLPGHKLELGRACIQKDYRTGAVINLLWKGIAAYAKEIGADYLFGCASVQSEDAAEIRAIQNLLADKELLSTSVGVSPLEKYRPSLALLDNSHEPKKAELPALIQSYIVAGAKFYGEPAHDRDFQCHDFFMALKFSEMHPAFKRRYGI